MKYVLIRCEDSAGIKPRGSLGLLDVAKLTYLHDLAQAGTVGLMSASGGTSRQRPEQVNGLQAHWSWLGYAPADVPAWEAGRCYAASVDVELREQEIAWCCELVTQQEGRLIDLAAGKISTKEASTLVGLLNATLGTPTRRWILGEGSHQILIIQAQEGANALPTTTIDPPERVAGRSWRRHLPRDESGKWMRALLEEAAPVLERHEVNKVRLDLGENPANMLWLWGPSVSHEIVSFKTHAGLSGAIVSSAFPLRGLARLLGLTWSEGIVRLDESGFRRLSRDIPRVLAAHDLVYLHLRIDQADPIQRQCAMERLDQLLLKPLTEQLMRLGDFRCLVAVDDRQTSTTPFVAIGARLPSRPVVRLTSHEAAKTGLMFHDGAAVFHWLTRPGER